MIHYSSSFLEFLARSESKIAKLLFRASQTHWHHNSYRLFITDKAINYITFRNDGTISFLPAGKEHKVNDDGQWARDGRQNGKPAKVIQKLFTKNALKVLTAKDFELFTNYYKSEYCTDGFQFELRPHKQIPDVYCMPRVNRSRLGDSCMNGDDGYMDIYASCKKLSILTLVDTEGNLCGRALVWKCSDTLTLMDRIYTSVDYLDDMFLAYAKEKGWHHKKHYQTRDYQTTFVNPEGMDVTHRVTIKTPTDFDVYPYIDTFCYGGDGFLQNYVSSGCIYEYTDTGGERSCESEDEEEDDHDGQSYDDLQDCYINDEDAIYIDRGERCYRGKTTHVDNCVNVDGYWYHEDDSTIVKVGNTWYTKDSGDIMEIDDEWYKMDDCCFCELEDEYRLTDDCVYSEHHHTSIPKDQAVEIDDDYYDKEHDDVVEIDDEWYLKDDESIEEVDGVWQIKVETE